jgi:hypothetical protein
MLVGFNGCPRSAGMKIRKLSPDQPIYPRDCDPSIFLLPTYESRSSRPKPPLHSPFSISPKILDQVPEGLRRRVSSAETSSDSNGRRNTRCSPVLVDADLMAKAEAVSETSATLSVSSPQSAIVTAMTAPPAEMESPGISVAHRPFPSPCAELEPADNTCESIRPFDESLGRDNADNPAERVDSDPAQSKSYSLDPVKPPKQIRRHKSFVVATSVTPLRRELTRQQRKRWASQDFASRNSSHSNLDISNSPATASSKPSAPPWNPFSTFEKVSEAVDGADQLEQGSKMCQDYGKQATYSNRPRKPQNNNIKNLAILIVQYSGSEAGFPTVQGKVGASEAAPAEKESIRFEVGRGAVSKNELLAELVEGSEPLETTSAGACKWGTIGRPASASL